MRQRRKRPGTVLMAGLLSVTLLSACSPTTEPSGPTEGPSAGQETPEETSQPASSVYEFPTMGLTVTLPETLQNQMDQEKVSMFTGEIGTEDGSALQYGYLSWNMMSEEETGESDSFNFEIGTQCAGVLGVYQADLVSQLDDLTGCNEHQALGQSADGAYQYYLSINTMADEKLIAEIRKIQATITKMADFQQLSDPDMPHSEFTGTSLGEFATQDINGNPYTQDVFQDYDLTMVNVFATWCSPCVAEMPDLEKLHQQMADRGVQVVGVVLDVLNEKGEIVQENLDRAQQLVEQTKVTYPILLPDATYMNGRLTGIEAFPETFFVDKDGNLVGEVYSGSGSLEDWLDVVERELANLKEGA